MNNSTPSSNPQPISIWRPQQKEGQTYFVRPQPSLFGDHYAQQHILSPHKPPNTYRICFFGESAAAGYLLAPHLTPAQHLQTQLNHISRSTHYQVIDLARTNEQLVTLVTTVKASLQLQPDMLIIFVGNNWNLLETPAVSPYAPTPEARQAYAHALRQDGVLGPIALAARQRLHRTAAALHQIHEIAQAAAIPVILIVPEVNLADWQSQQPVVWLPNGQTAQWYAYYNEAQTLLKTQMWEAILPLTKKMSALDGHTCPTPYRLQALAYQALGDKAAARQACLAEVECDQYATLCFISAPRITRMDQALLRRSAQQYHFSLVDLPAIFTTYNGHPLPGRRLFLDYCHLTPEGINVSMAAVTAEVLRYHHGQTIPWPTILKTVPPPTISKSAVATAYLGAAIHTAHRMVSVTPSTPLLEYWCEAARAASAGIEATMLDLIRARVAPVPAVLTAAQQRNLASPYPLTLQHGWQYDFLDAQIVMVLQTVLTRHNPASQAEIDNLLLAHQTMNGQSLDLATSPYYLWQPAARFYPEVMAPLDFTQPAAYQAAWPVSQFALICSRQKQITLDIVARQPFVEPIRWSCATKSKWCNKRPFLPWPPLATTTYAIIV